MLSILKGVSRICFKRRIILFSTIQASAQPLVKDAPTGNLIEEVDISIRVRKNRSPRGTVSISTEGATEPDMDAFPHEGVTVTISSDTFIVTNQTVDIGTAEEDEGDEEEERRGS
jgi:hypothetical protein